MSQKAPKFQRSVLARSVLIACGATATVLAMQPAFAQDATTQLQRIEITGSAIKRIDAETAVPVTVVKMEELQKEGITTIEQVMAKLSSVQAQTGTSQDVGAGTGGASFADVRGLGANQTLVLLNGRRVAVNAISGGAVDLNMIPFAALDRVEVLRDGASSLYGSDAISGVINFITKSEYSGFAVTVGLDKPANPGANGGGVNVGGGIGSLDKDGYNIFGFLDSKHQDFLQGSQRSFNSRYPGGLSSNPFPANYGQSDNGSKYMNPAAPGCVSDPSQSIFLTPYPGLPSGCKEVTTGFVDYIPKQTRDSGFLKGTFKLGADTQLGLEYFMTRDTVQSNIAPVPYFGLAMNRLMPNGQPNPYFPGNPGAIPFSTAHTPYDPAFTGLYGEATPGFSSAGAYRPGGPTGTAVAPGFIYVDWRALAGGTRHDLDTNTQSRFVASLDGTLAGWDYQVGLTYNENKIRVDLSGYTDGGKVGEGMLSGILNPFGPQSAAGLAFMADAAISGQQQEGMTTSKGVDAHASRELGDWLGAGRNVSIAVGGSYAQDSMYQVGIDHALNVASQSSTGFDPNTNNSGARNVSALFAEFNIPIIKSLEVTVAGREDMYSDFGNTFNPKVGFRWQPSQELLVRGSMSTGFRAPTLYELYGGNAFTTTSEVLDTQNNILGQFEGLTGGNSALKPQTSKNATLGIVLEPVKNLTLEADLWSIELNHVISTLPDTTAFADEAQFASYFHRNALGNLSQSGLACPGASCGYFDERWQNLGGTQTNGVDLSASYTIRQASIGSINMNLQSTYVNKYDYQDYENGPWNQNVGVYSGAGPIFKWTHNASVDWTNGSFAAGLAGHYKSGYVGQNAGTQKNGAWVDSYVTWDLYGSYKPVKSVTLTAGVKNLFDQDPPLSYQVAVFQAGYDPRFSDPTGRTYYLRGTYAF